MFMFIAITALETVSPVQSQGYFPVKRTERTLNMNMKLLQLQL